MIDLTKLIELQAAAKTKHPLEFPNALPDFLDYVLDFDFAALDEKIKRYEDVLAELLDYLPEPPDKNCSCHINPPCNDCVAYTSLRDAITDARKALEQ